uniref:Ig-like domain-containing protein n=1 Tax=Escherichia coli TaxID=562 RepID=UPI0022780263|nr:Ig-like domain-containing protein [Escherichia coli]UGK56473.1 hypothetical protein [Escherichia coli]
MTFDYSALPSGKYTATGAATDTYNNTAELTLSNTILHDVTPPVVDISFEGKQADGALVKGLEKSGDHTGRRYDKSFPEKASR